MPVGSTDPTERARRARLRSALEPWAGPDTVRRHHSRDRGFGGALPTLTVLFVDQVDSTMLLSDRGERGVSPQRDALFRILRSAVADHEGEVVDHTGDGIMAFFSGAREALDAAAAMQAGAAQLDDVHLRVGINSGEPAVDGDGRYFGMPLVIAARLCAKAGRDEVLASLVVKLLTRDDALVDPVPYELKGIAEPVPAYRYEWRAGSTDTPLALPVTADLPLTGRDAELEQLQQAWEQACAREHAAVFVVGEPGAGKSRLVAELLRSRPDAAALIGRCEDGGGPAFQPFADALRSHLERFGPVDLGSAPEELGRLVPELRSEDRPMSSDPEAERQALFDAVRSWLAAAAAGRPLVLLIDDLHWAGEPTVRLLLDVMRARTPGLLVLGTYRGVDVVKAPLGAHLADLLRLPGTSELHLDGLDVDAVQSLAAAAGAEIDATELCERTAGNALFVTELLRAPGGSTMPTTVSSLLSQRIELLPPDTSKVLAVGALAGPSFPPALVEEALTRELPAAEVLDGLEAAEALGLLQETAEGDYRFTHALIRDALVDGISAARASRVHADLAVSGERLGIPAADIAHHHLSSRDRRHLADAARWSVEAANQAFAAAAFEDAVAVLERALAAVGRDHAASATLLCELGVLQRRLRVYDAARPLLVEAAELADRNDDAETLASAALALTGSYMGGDVDAAAGAPFLDAAERRLEPADSPLRARVLAAQAVVSRGDDEAAHQLVLEAEAMAVRLGDRATLGYVTQGVWTTKLRMLPYSAEDALRYAPVLRERCAASGVTEVIVTAPILGIHECALRGDLTALAGVADESEARGRRYNLNSAQANAQLARGVIALVGGRPDDAEARWGEAMGLAGQDAFTQGLALSQMVWLRRHQGRLEELAPMFEPGALPRTGDPFRDVLLDAHAAMALAELGRDGADKRLLAAIDQLPPSGGGWAAVFVLSVAAATARSQQAADRLIPLLEPWRGLQAYLVHASWFGPADGLLADLYRVAGEPARALDLYDAAFVQVGDADAPTWRARLHVGRWHALTDLGRDVEAEQARRHAGDEASRAELPAVVSATELRHS